MCDINTKYYSIDYYHDSEKPEVREKILGYSINEISDIELIMALLGNGKKGVPISKLAEKVLQVLNTKTHDELKDSLMKIQCQCI